MTNSDGTERLLEVCREIGVQRFIFVSTIAVYEWNAAKLPLREDAPLRPASAYGQSKLDAENAVRAYPGDWVVARLGTVFGRGDRANFARLAVALRDRRFVVPGGGGARKSVISVDCAGELIGELALRQEISNEQINMAAPHAPSLGEICAAFSQVCGFRPPPSLPIWLLRRSAFVGDIIERMTGSFPLTSNTFEKLTTSTIVDVSRLEAIFAGREWKSFPDYLRESGWYYKAFSAAEWCMH